MSKLNDLIAELCPNGVEYVKLSDLCTIQIGTQLNKENLKSDGKYPVYNGGIYPSGYYDSFNTEANTIAISQGGASAGFVHWIDVPFYAGAHCYVIKNISQQILPRYLYFFLKSRQENIQNAKQGVGIPELTRDFIRNFKVPIFPLPIQEYIVDILDDFTTLISDLNTEINLRRQQYEYYRNILFTFDENISWYNLSEILKIKYGKDYSTFNTGNIPVYGSGGIIAYIDTFIYDKPSVLIPRIGSVDNLFYVETPFWTIDTIFYTEIFTHKAIPKYVYYWLQKEHLEQYNIAGGIPSLTRPMLNKIKIPLPSLDEQQRIVDILDCFDILCNDSNIGISAEIEARQQQYEYYRDRLLSFNKI